MRRRTPAVRGRRTVNRAPPSGGDSAVMPPPIISVSSRAIERPRPAPGRRAALLAPAMEPLEHVRQLLAGDARAVVGDDHDGLLLLQL